MATKRMTWLKLYVNNREILTDMVEDAELGKALKLVMQYFADGGTLPEEDIPRDGSGTQLAYMMLRQGADESLEDYARQSAAGRRGASMRAMKAMSADVNEMLEDMEKAEEDTFSDSEEKDLTPTKEKPVKPKGDKASKRKTKSWD